MTISSREKEVPIRLPAACLYIDDIEEIREIILYAAASRVLRPEIDPTQHEVETKFYIGDQVCTEIQDLPKIKKRTHDFEMRLSAPDGFTARFGVSVSTTQWTTNGLTKADTWRAFHKLETVFERRKIRWRNLLPRETESVRFVLVMFLLLALLFFGSGAARVIYKLAPSHEEFVSVSFTLAALALITAVTPLVLRHSVVVLRYSWDQAAQREDRNTKILIAAVSALTAFLLTVLGYYLKHKYWP